MTVTPNQIKRFLFCDVEKAAHIANLVNEVFPRYGLDTLLRIRMCLAQMAHESWNFTKKEENLNYSAQALANTWPTRFAVDAKAEKKIPLSIAYDIQRKPEVIANKVYGNRMGNDVAGDGWHFRGSSFLQLTGKGNITAYGKYRATKEPENPIWKDPYKVAELLRKDDYVAMDASCWFLTKYTNIVPCCDKEDIKTSTKLINGAQIGLAERTALYSRAKEIFV